MKLNTKDILSGAIMLALALVGYWLNGDHALGSARRMGPGYMPWLTFILLGGIGASGGLLQRRLDLPDAAVVVLQGILFVAILASETLYGRLWKPKEGS